VTPELPAPQLVMATDGVRLATYDFGGEPFAPVVVAVHGFSSSAADNWVVTGWVRDLQRAGLRVLAYDQRGHGASGKPHDPAYLGYSLGARVGWFGAIELPHHVTRAVLGGVSEGDLSGFDLEAARRHARDGSPIADRLTSAYVSIAERNPANDLEALIALIEGMQRGAAPDPGEAPQQPVLFATGTEDPVIGVSCELATATPHGEFVEIPGRTHFNAPTSGEFRRAGVEFLSRPSPPPPSPR
jgi:pimeloyl-ACP methyl ester carboxylesterase